MFLRLRLVHSVARLYSAALPVALVFAPVAAMSAPFDPGFAVDGDPIGNALFLILWFVSVISFVSAAVLAVLGITASRCNRSDAPSPVRRRVIP